MLFSKKLVCKLLFWVHLLVTCGFSQYTIDGDFSESEYQLLATKLNNNSGFGPAEDVSNIFYGTDDNNLYLGFECQVQNTPNQYNPKPDGLGVLLNFNSETGSPAGTPLGFDTNSNFHFINGSIETGWSWIDFKADFEVDYLFAFYSDGTPGVIIFDAATHVASYPDSIQNIGTSDQSGTAVSGPASDGIFSSDSIVFAYQNSTGSGSRNGAEIKIPFSEFNGEPYDQFQLFANIIGSTAYFSDVTIPGDVTSGNSGANPDYSININSQDCWCPSPGGTIGIGPFHTELTALGESRPVIITIPSDTLDFGKVFIGSPDTLSITVRNWGAELLIVTDISLTGEDFIADQDTFSLSGGESHLVSVIFDPTTVQEYLGSLTISSNDTANPAVSIVLVGEGLLPPDISASPDSLSESLLTGAASVQFLTLENTGDSDLEWDIHIEGIGLGTVTFTKEDYADWTLPENQDRITENVGITRANTNGIFNAATEDGYSYDSPDDTEWAYGLTEDLNPSDYQTWRAAVYPPPSMVGQPLSLHLISDDLYFDMMFHSWTSGGNGGGFSYTRTDVRPVWLSVTPDSGAIPAGSNEVLAVNFDATGLVGGDYDADIVINSNDPDEPEIIIPVNLNVTGASDIYVETDTLNFGQVFVNYSDTLALLVENLGTEDLLITSVETDPAEYTVSPVFAGINPGEDNIFQLAFSPMTVGTYPGTLTFVSTDPDEDTVVVVLLGEGIEPPVVAVTPDSLMAYLFTNDSSQQVLTISNTGNSDLFYEIFAHSTDSSETYGRNVDRTPNVRMSQSLGNSSHISSLNRTSLRQLLHLDSINPDRRPSIGIPSTEARNSRTEPGWQFLYSDPDEPDAGLDVESVYGGNSYDEIFFKLTTYHSIDDGPFMFIVAIDSDQDIGTGLDIDSEEGYGWLLGIDYILWAGGGGWPSYGINGILLEYVEREPDVWDFVLVDSLTTGIFELGTDEIIVGISNSHFEGSTALNIAFETEGANEGVMDQIPDYYDGHITFSLSPPWLSFSSEQGIIPANSQEIVTVTFDATGLFGGDYYANIDVLSNDPVTPEVSIPTHLSVTGIPLYSGPDTLDFGVSYIGYPHSMEFVIENPGTDVLEITNLTSSDTRLTVTLHSLSIPPVSSVNGIVELLADAVGTFTANLSFNTNDGDNPTVTIPVVSMLLIAPEISVTPDTIGVTVPQGTTVTDTFLISNSGGSDLIWEITPENADFNIETFTKIDYADWTLPENQDHITENVWITRANTNGIFNAATENGYSYDSPDDTEWAYGLTEDLTPSDYQTWRTAVYPPPSMVGQPLSLHLISDDLYFDMMFHSWTSDGNGGGFSYTRTPPQLSWLSVSQESGITHTDSTDDIVVNFDAQDLDPGDYRANIVISSNDPANPEIDIPIHLNVTGVANLVVEIDSINFGETFVFYGAVVDLVIVNDGTEVLEISNVSVDNDAFLVSPTSLSINYGSSDTVTVTFIPTIVGNYSGTLSIISNDLDQGTLTIPLLGSSVEPPIIAVTPDSLIEDLYTGGVDSQMVTISNSGVSDLLFEITINDVPRGSISPIAATHNPSATDETSPEIDTANWSTSTAEAVGQRVDFFKSETGSQFINIQSPRTDAPRVLLMSNDGPTYDFTGFAKMALLNTRLFSSSDIDILDDPDYIYLTDLMPYDAILVWSNLNFTNPQNIGDVLKQYVDDGGGVIIATYAYSTSWAIQGAILNPGYSPFIPTTTQSVSGQIDMGSLPSAEHPIFNSIITAPAYWWNSSYSNPPLNTGGILLATDTYGNNVVAENASGKVVGIAIFPGILDVNNSDTNTSTRRMFANALYYVGRTSWLTVGPASGTIPAGSSFDVEVNFDASNLSVGYYSADIVIASNDPDENITIIPVQLTVSGLDVGDESIIPGAYVLHQNFPNPFNPITTIRYDLPEQSHVTITIYDLLGRQVKTLVNRVEEPGYKSMVWDGANDLGKLVGAGVYLYRIVAGDFVQTNKMILLK